MAIIYTYSKVKIEEKFYTFIIKLNKSEKKTIVFCKQRVNY